MFLSVVPRKLVMSPFMSPTLSAAVSAAFAPPALPTLPKDPFDSTSAIAAAESTPRSGELPGQPTEPVRAARRQGPTADACLFGMPSVTCSPASVEFVTLFASLPPSHQCPSCTVPVPPVTTTIQYPSKPPNAARTRGFAPAYVAEMVANSPSKKMLASFIHSVGRRSSECDDEM